MPSWKRSCIVVIAFIVVSCSAQSTMEEDRPNIILIVADDLGYSDLGCYGGEINTPVLNQLASEGVRLTNMHNAGMCIISRTSLLTGQWWPRVDPGFDEVTNVAQVLQADGYRTGLVGKWHLAGEPNQLGFDYFFGFLGGYASYYTGSPSYRLNETKFDDFGEDYYSTDAFTDRAVEFVRGEPNGAEDPFFYT